MKQIDIQPENYRKRDPLTGRWFRVFDKRFWTFATIFYGAILVFVFLSPRALPETRMAILTGGLLTAPFVISATILLWNLFHKR